MKKIIVVIILFGILLTNIKVPAKKTEEKELRAVFVSYIELQSYVKNSNQNTSKKNIDKIISNVKKINLNTIILQVRSQSDTIYPSKIFPFSSFVSSKEGENYYDVLEYFLKKSHENNIKLYAWINPYRIRTSSNIESISKENPAYKYLNTDTIYVNNGIYYNPSKKEVTDLIVSGVKEVLAYDIDGILFDDYFYPNTEIDKNDYEEYIKENNYISESEYRLGIISNMLEKVHTECKKKNVPFGVSPDGNIENNYSKHYADVRKWTSSKKYIDFIMPQIYYGFYNSTRAFKKAADEWESLIKSNGLDLYIALAFYKVGTSDQYAKLGKDEWLYNDDIIMREIIISRNLKHYKGFALFRYSNIFDTSKYTSTSIEEIENMKKILK